ncbi:MULTISPECIES: glycosyltransferase [unclassified Microbacterium]|uniref:glycosyltransferase n=1 Tax=unclassified Microbacterium TaxID=2609290 RepID=UPI00214B1728|nr:MULTISPECIES: glycosyltransferase [unclassified Microbacterium]MCR2784956.1 glycosyltransferase [Microbacterium sp. zg.B96]WIM16495.1 glycosyltransferase [Microbacterium sp. zg-B96]
MRIAQVVTYISPDGAFGGPSRVALGQAAALAERGHDVTVFAASPLDVVERRSQDGYILSKFPGRKVVPGDGFALMRAPRLNKAFRTQLSSFDVVHVHLARDLVTMPVAVAARMAGVPYVVQTHGMIDASGRWLARALDRFATKPVLRGARAALVLTDQEELDLRGVEPSVKIVRISNGIRVGQVAPYEGRKNRVLFLARLQERKRPVAFVEMATLLHESFPETEFVLVGPDEGEAAATQTAIERSGHSGKIRWVGPASPDETSDWIASARVYVLPSFGEVFPMTILEALSVGTPVVATDSLGIAGACGAHGAALITDGTARELAGAVARILTDSRLASELRAGGSRYLRKDLDISNVAAHLEDLYAAHAGASS